MKKIGDYFKELGFNPDSSDGAKKAFVKHLINQARLQDRWRGSPAPPESLPALIEAEEKAALKEEQLSLFDLTGTDD